MTYHKCVDYTFNFILGSSTNHSNPSNTAPQFNKTQIKALQEAMYHSVENNHLDITIEIRTLGVPWTLHCWMHSLGNKWNQMFF